MISGRSTLTGTLTTCERVVIFFQRLVSNRKVVSVLSTQRTCRDSRGADHSDAMAVPGLSAVFPGSVWGRFTDGAASKVERRVLPLDLVLSQNTDVPIASGLADIRLVRIGKRDENCPRVNLDRPHDLRRFAKARAKFGPSSWQLGPFDRGSGSPTSCPDLKASVVSIPPADRVMSVSSLRKTARRVGSTPAAGLLWGAA